MILGLDLFDHLVHYPVLIDKEGHAVNTIIFSPHELFGSPDPKGIDHFFFGIRQQREWEFVFVPEIALLLFGIGTYPK